MTRLTPDNGIPRRILLMMAVMAGFTVANLYYNQPLLDMICRETGITHVEANLITVITQIGRHSMRAAMSSVCLDCLAS